MAGHHPFLTRIRVIVRALDDEALIALANKGLLRRAQKDLETSRPVIKSCDDDAIHLTVADAQVDLPELPTKSKCSCPATGICRHILTALLYLRDDPELAALDAPRQRELFPGESADDTPTIIPADAPSPADIIGAATDAELEHWAGKSLVKKAYKLLATNPPVEFETTNALMVRFPTRNITCRWLASGRLLGMVCSCQAETICEHVVAAVLAFQASLGKRTISHEHTPLQESAGASRTRDEVLASVGSVLYESAANGLARLSQATIQRLVTLAVSAHGVDLPRLERMLAGLAREMELVVNRDAQSSTTNVLLGLSRLEALRAALQRNPQPSLVGQHRTSYYEVGHLTLHGIGAQWWRSKGGYHGVTVYFWDESSQDWLTWSDSRPVDQAGFHPIGRFRSDGPWTGCGGPNEAAHSVVRLTHAYRNAAGRLSGRAATNAAVLGNTDITSLASKIPALSNWSELAPRIQQLYGGGLTGPPPNRELVLLQPTSWLPANFDSLRQVLMRPILDQQNQPLVLWLPYTPEFQEAVELLDKFTASENCYVFGALRMVAGALVVQPISLLTTEKTIHLNLPDNHPSSPVNQQNSPPAVTGEDSLDADEDALPFDRQGPASALASMLITAQAELEALVENGLIARRGHEILDRLAQRFRSLGLTACAAALASLHEQLTSTTRLADRQAQQAAAATLLQAYYLLQLAAEQETLLSAKPIPTP